MKTFAVGQKKCSLGLVPKRATVAPPADSHWRIGRAAVRQILRGPRLQAKLTIGSPDDVYEQEADRVADEVMRMTKPQLHGVSVRSGLGSNPQGVQQKSDSDRIQARPAGFSSGSQIATPPIVNEVLNLPGQPLDTRTRAYLEPHFGYDFSQVHVHSGAKAAESAQAVGALAYTVGNDVVFGQGHYVAGAVASNQLLAHELVHVVQQSSGLAHGAIQRSVDPAQVACDPNVANMPDDPVRALHMIDSHAQAFAVYASYSLFIDSFPLGTPSIGVGKAFDAYLRRFGPPPKTSMGFLDRFSWTPHETLEAAEAQELKVLSIRFEELRDFLSGTIQYKCAPLDGALKIGTCAGVCKATDLAVSCVPDDERTIGLCAEFWNISSVDQKAAVIIHEAAHMLFDYSEEASSDWEQRRRNPECFASFIADLVGFAPLDPSCPALLA